MQKSFAIFLTILLIFGFNGVVYAEGALEAPHRVGDFFFKYEKVEGYNDQLLFSRDGRNYKKADTPAFFVAGSSPLYGNGRYILTDIYPLDFFLGDNYLAEGSNSPLYVFDENFNLITTVKYGGYLREYFYQDGRFFLHFLYKEDPSQFKNSQHSYCDLIFETFDGVNWTFRSIDGVANTFDFKGQDLIEVVEKPEYLFLEDKRSPYDILNRIGDYYFSLDAGVRSFTKDAVEFTPLFDDSGGYVNICDGGYGGGMYFGFGSCYDSCDMYAYDSDMNLLYTKKWEGDMRGTFVYFKGMFYLKDYVKKTNAQSDYNRDKKYYRSSDGFTWESIDETEYEIAQYTKILQNGSEWYKRYTLENGNWKEYIDGIPVSRETLYENQDVVKYQKSVMRDGLKKIYLPLDSNIMTGVRTDDNYMYIKIDVLDSKCYRIPLSAFESEIKIMYGGSFLAFDVAPVIEDGRTLIPLRFLFEQMGAKVIWNGKSRTVTVKQDDKTIVFSIGNSTAIVNGVEKNMDVPARLINDKTMIPLRFVSEGLGYTVDWDETTRIAKINKQ